MSANDELLQNPEYRNEKLSALKKESDYFTELRSGGNQLNDGQNKAYRAVTGEWARIHAMCYRNEETMKLE